MVASRDTISRVLRVVDVHVSNQTFKAILHDLQDVPGNKSFRDTISRMIKEYELMEKAAAEENKEFRLSIKGKKRKATARRCRIIMSTVS